MHYRHARMFADFEMAIDFRIYLITDRKQAKIPLPEAIRLALKGGVRAIQLREKDLPIRDLLALAQELRAITREFGARLFINDRVDVAVAVEADGIHLGHESMPVGAVRKIVGDNMLIGVSCHSIEDAWEADTHGADFITFGPMFPTPSKIQYGKPVGLDALSKAARKVHAPVFGLGGVGQANVLRVMLSGAFGISLISGIFATDDIQQAALEMNDLVSRALAGERPEQ
jgi:thiamine-phosphate pyrophosphorylase